MTGRGWLSLMDFTKHPLVLALVIALLLTVGRAFALDTPVVGLVLAISTGVLLISYLLWVARTTAAIKFMMRIPRV